MILQLSHSLRGRLLWFLLAAISLAALVQVSVAYRTALVQTDALLDYQMQQMAMSLRTGLAAGNPDAEPDPDLGEENYDFVVQIWTADGLRIYQSAAQADLPQRAVLGFSEVKAHGSTYRVFSVQTRAQIIQVAQDMAVRRSMAGSLALRTIAPTALMAPLLMLLVWWVVSHSLAPVARVQRQVAKRQANDLSPVNDSELPDEVRPLVQELNLLFARVQRAFDAQQHFVADAAHELRSPLAALKLQVQGLQRAVGSDARELAITRLLAGIDRATRLIEQLLLLARHEASAASGAKMQRVALVELAKSALADVLQAAQERGIDIGLGRADEAVIEGDPDALAVLVRNLLENAIKYTPPGGSVDLEVESEGDYAACVVQDSGPGIPAQDRERVLDRFYRMQVSGSSGSGLGLAIVKSVAELHAANVTLDTSPRLGGLRVTVRFSRLA